MDYEQKPPSIVSLLLHPPDNIDLEVLIAELYGRGTTGIVEHDGAIEAFFETEAEALIVAADFTQFSPNCRNYGNRDFVAEMHQQWQPVLVGRRFWLAASWDETATPIGRIRLEYQAGMACGSGVHPCTRLCIAALENRVFPGAQVLDVGVGSGILLMAARSLGATLLAGCDIDHDSVVLAQNAIPEALLFTGSTDAIPDRFFDVVIANISSAAAEQLHSELRRVCRGTIVVSGFRVDDLPEGYCDPVVELEEWAAISDSSSARS